MKVLIIALVALLGLLPSSILVTTTESYCEFSSDKKIIQERIIKDFDDNEFKLYELDNGYAIYSLDDGKENFIEGSYETNSPYKSCNSSALRYLGPGNYFYIDNGEVIDILDKVVVEDELDTASYKLDFDNRIETRSSSNPDPSQTITDTKGFTVVNRADYFKNLKKFPNNFFGECGLIALSILLGYYDNFYNDNFIPNDKTYTARYYDSSTNTLLYTKNENLTCIGYAYLNSSNPFTKWADMPGTSYAMRDYLFDNYMHTVLGIGVESKGYPMLDGELAATLKDYMKENCPSLLNNIEIRNGALFYTHARPIEYINEGLPTCLVLKDYKINYEDNKYGKDHIVVAYGHQNGNFLAHFGWGPNTANRTQVIISDATIRGYFTFKYTGEHVHSTNVRVGATKRYIRVCGCGYEQKIDPSI